MALESCKALDTCQNARVIERKYSTGQKYLFELRRCSSDGGLSNRESSYRESTVNEFLVKMCKVKKEKPWCYGKESQTVSSGNAVRYFWENGTWKHSRTTYST